MSECYASEMYYLARGKGRLEEALAKVKEYILSEAKGGKFSLEINFDELDGELFEDYKLRLTLLLLLRGEGFSFNEDWFRSFPHHKVDIRWDTVRNKEKL